MKRRIVLTAGERSQLERAARGCKDASLRTRMLIIAHSADGSDREEIAEALGCDVSTVSRARARWCRSGWAGLADRRAFNGTPKVDQDFREAVRWMLELTPPDFGRRRPTWTRPDLVDVAEQYTSVRVSVTTMGRVLRRLRARLGRPKPVAPCPRSEKAREARMKVVHRLIATLPRDEVAVWEDEVDLDLNPKIGRDWILPGTQRRVMTPGQNVRRYLAVAMDAIDTRLTWTTAKRKNSALFIALLRRLLARHGDKKRVHVILDNYGIHASRQARAFLARHPKLRLHFLPPYCPDDNRVERQICRELHANVTINHQHTTIEDLLRAVHGWMIRQDRKAVAELRQAI